MVEVREGRGREGEREREKKGSRGKRGDMPWCGPCGTFQTRAPRTSAVPEWMSYGHPPSVWWPLGRGCCSYDPKGREGEIEKKKERKRE